MTSVRPQEVDEEMAAAERGGDHTPLPLCSRSHCFHAPHPPPQEVDEEMEAAERGGDHLAAADLVLGPAQFRPEPGAAGPAAAAAAALTTRALVLRASDAWLQVRVFAASEILRATAGVGQSESLSSDIL